MAKLKLPDSEIVEQIDKIQQELACIQVLVENHEDFCNFEEFLNREFVKQDVLSYAEKEQIILFYQDFYQDYLERNPSFSDRSNPLSNPQKSASDRTFYDLLSLHPGSPHLYSLITTYGRYHTHADAEILHLLGGEAIFGFVKLDGSQLEVLLQAGDYIHIPPRCEHYFSLTASLQCKAVRYFATTNGWVPQHTNRVKLDRSG